MNPRNAGIEARQYLLNANRDAISVMLGRAAESGLDTDDAVVVVVDQRDPVGCEIAEVAAENAGLNAAEEGARALGRGEIPTAILVLELKVARALFAESHPAVSNGLSRRPPHGCCRTVVIAAGAATLLHAPVRPVQAAG